MNYRIILCCFSLLPIAAAADAPAMARVLHQSPRIEQFDFCWGGTCAGVLRTGLNAAEWQQVRALFQPPPADAAGERERIARAIGLVESLIGPKTGTAGDRAGTYRNFGIPGQLDCNDEAANSTTYMRLMANDGLIRHHVVHDTTTRGYYFFVGRHSAAVIEDSVTGQRYAVDSWFYDNGHAAVILPLETWKNGWKPENTTAY